ncbi:hypothetical protein P7C70_g6067, partial [Phenoliferia sp. Uapishka_3]
MQPHASPTSDLKLVNAGVARAISDRKSLVAASDAERLTLKLRRTSGLLSEGSHIRLDLKGTTTDSMSQVVHPQISILDWARLTGLSRSRDEMSQTLLCVLAIAEAQAAKFSDHPVVISQGENGPKLEKFDRYVGKNFCHIGDAREKFVRTMTDRALAFVDSSGILRKPPTAITASTLVMASLLTPGSLLPLSHFDCHALMLSTSKVEDRGHLLNAACEHIRTLHNQIPVDQTYPDGGNEFWLIWMQDALGATSTGRRFFLTPEDVADLCSAAGRLRSGDVSVFDRVTSMDPAALAGDAVVSLNLQILDLMRNFNIQIAGPSARRLGIDVFAVQELWDQIFESQRCTSAFADTVQRVNWPKSPNLQLWLRDIASKRLNLAYQLYKTIRLRCGLLESVAHRGVENGNGELERDLDDLGNLLAVAEENLLPLVQDFTILLRHFGPSVATRAAFAAESFPSYAEFILKLPTTEHGGLIEGWTLQAKISELESMVLVLGYLGWSRPGYSVHVNASRVGIAECRRRLEHLESRRPSVLGDVYLPETPYSSSLPSPAVSYRTYESSFERTQINPPPCDPSDPYRTIAVPMPVEPTQAARYYHENSYASNSDGLGPQTYGYDVYDPGSVACPSPTTATPPSPCRPSPGNSSFIPLPVHYQGPPSALYPTSVPRQSSIRSNHFE